jgi:bile acid:Na+ symporter, BASS family
LDLATLIPLALKASILFIVFALGLTATVEDVTYFFRRPARLLKSLLSMNVAMLLFAVVIVLGFKSLSPAVKFALVILAIAPVPPILPRKAMKAGGKSSHAFGLLIVAGLFSIAFIPLALELVERVFQIPLQMPPAAVAQLVLITAIAPLGAGIAVHRFAPELAVRLAKPVSLVATLLLVIGLVALLFAARQAIVSLIGNGTLVALAGFVVAGLTFGHLLGGPDPEDRVVLGLATASRHPGVALAIADANFPQQKKVIMAALLLYLIVNAIVTIPYLKWMKRRSSTREPFSVAR